MPIYNSTVALLTYRTLLGRRRVLLLAALPALLLAVSAAVRVLAGADDGTTRTVLSGLALATMLPLVGVIAGTGAIGPEIDDGSVAYLLAKPVRRSSIVVTKLLVVLGAVVAFGAVPTALAGLVLDGGSRRLALAFGVAAVAAAAAYSALFLLLAVVTRHAVVVGLVYALLWESVVGSLVPGARALSVQQWALALAQRIAAGGAVSSQVGLPAAVVLLVFVVAGATWFAVHRLSRPALAGEE